MSDRLLLRFRELTENVNTVEAHNQIAHAEGAVYWGWWKKPPELMPDPAMAMLLKEVQTHPGWETIFFINSADSSLYQAKLFEIRYLPGGTEIPPPNPAICPEYYRQKRLSAWFKIGIIEPAQASLLNEYVFSPSNRTAFDRSATALNNAEIGQVVADTKFLDSNISLWFVRRTEEVGFSERTEAVKALSVGIWPAKGRYALHLSDLHFGDQHGFRNELAPAREPRLAKETLAEALIQDLATMNPKLDDIALVLVSGDLSWTGDAHEFANADAFFRRLRNAFGLHVSQIVVVPGNHDIEWRHGDGDVDPNAELNYSSFCRTFYHTPPEDSLLRIHQFSIMDRHVCIIGLNSCRIESKSNAGLGFVGREQLHLLAGFLKQQAAKGNAIRIALMHHHLGSVPIPVEK